MLSPESNDYELSMMAVGEMSLGFFFLKLLLDWGGQIDDPEKHNISHPHPMLSYVIFLLARDPYFATET